MARRNETFSAITTEGGLLPADLFQALLSPKGDIEGSDPQSYHLAAGEKIGDQVNRSWNRLQGCWQNYRKAITAKSEGEPTTTETRERWLYPLFQELGFGRLAAARPIQIDGREYPISHAGESVPIHLVGSHVDLDRRTPGAVGAARMSPHSMLQQALNNSDGMLWGLVSNGLTLRLLRDNVALSRQALVEFDLETILEGDLYGEFLLLWMVCHQSRFEGERPESCWLEKWKKIAEDTGLRALENLRPGVEAAITTLGSGFVAHRANADLRQKLSSGTLSTHDLYQQVLRVVYRMLFLFVAEDRGLLHPEDDSEAARRARKRYADFYSLGRLRSVRLNRAGTAHPDLWNAFRLVSQKLGASTGCPELALPPLGSFLWSGEATLDLDSCLIPNRNFLEAVHALAFIRDGNVRRSVDYRNLGAEELGSVYEGLLELHPIVNADSGTFELNVAAGNERKTTGSYYTPDSLVQCLLDSALEPVMAEAVKGKSGEDAARAILELKVCDAAVGSGHFLIAAAHRMAKRIAAIRSGEEEPSPTTVRSALRQVVGRCLYGVDINPMAAELCKVSLWLEALEPGKPLSFLDHHIRVGNSLIGATPELIAKGIPDDAFRPIEGDDKKACAELKKINARERKGLGDLFAQEDLRIHEAIRQAAQAVDTMPDDTPDAIVSKTRAFEEAEANYPTLIARTVADTWCAAFVIQKIFPPGEKQPFGITQRYIQEAAAGHGLPDSLRNPVAELAGQYRFFHWHVAFPEVFAKGGFDCVLGNPPWERVKLQEKEWFAERNPEIANAPNAAARRRLIEKLTVDNPALYAAFKEDLRQAEGESHMFRDSGLFPLCGCGDVNLYAVFAESMRQHLVMKGRFGAVLPSGIAMDDTTKFFFQAMVDSRSLVALFDFENRAKLFPTVDSRMKFCLLTAGNCAQAPDEAAEFIFFAHQVQDLIDVERRFTLTADDIALLNPNSRTCPIFRTRRDVEITRAVYSRSVPISQIKPSIGFFSKIDMSDEVGEFLPLAKLVVEPKGFPISQADRTFLQLYESKLIWHYDHRFGTFSDCSVADHEAGNNRNPESREKADPNWFCVPRYFAPTELVDERYKAARLGRNCLLTVRRLTNATNERTAVFAVVPYAGCGNSMFVFAPSTRDQLFALLACGNSLAFDYVTRNKLGGTNFLQFIIEQLPVLPPAAYAAPCTWASQSTTPLRDWLLPRVLELSYTAWDLEPFAQDCGYAGPPFRWDDERRFLLRCELDAAFFHLYGIGQDDAAYIMDTFPIVKRKDEEKHGSYRTKDTILSIYDAMQEAIRTGQPYQTRLDPPPADPRCSHPTPDV